MARCATGMLLAGLALAGCSTQTNVSASSSVQQKYTHVYLTVQEVWFNTSANASAEDTTWSKFPLDTPVTIDLASLNAGTLGQIATSLKVSAGTYSQIRLIPVDASAALTASAQSAGAQFNSEADYTDSAGTAHQSPLELLNPDKGIAIATTINIKANLSAVLGTSTTTTTTTDPTTGQTITTPITTDPSTTSTPISLAISIDGQHDLVLFNYGTETGVLLNPHTAAYDVSNSGTIKGQVDTSNISVDSSTGQINVQVTAETVSADGSRHTGVKTVNVASDGSFVLYPLPAGSTTDSTGVATSTTTTTHYDLVIHGPAISTIIVKSVPVSAGDPTSTTLTSIGTVTPRSANTYTYNLASGTQTVPSGALVSLYQTIPVSGEVPYLIYQTPMDPFSRTLYEDQSLSEGTIDYGTYSSGTVTLQSVTPVEGAGVYLVAATATLFADGVFGATVAPPQSGTVLVTVPALLPGGGGASGTIPVTISPATNGKYDKGELIVSHDGAVVQTVAIDSLLTQNSGTTLQVAGLPAGGGSFDNSVYYLSVRAWRSTDPAGTLSRQSYSTPVDLSTGSAVAQTLTVQ
jgi:hypothetical protein